jgi:aryl-phospho-beta-D-glucosidase BglC (GH1 family)
MSVNFISVNLGGWFVLEPFITPTLFQKYPTAVDEWTISTSMTADTASGGLSQLENHYKTFIVSDTASTSRLHRHSSRTRYRRPRRILQRLPVPV